MGLDVIYRFDRMMWLGRVAGLRTKTTLGVRQRVLDN